MNRFANLSIRYKILLLAATSLIVFAVNLLISVEVNRDNRARLVSLREMYFPILERASANLHSLDKVVELLNSAAAAREEEFIANARVEADKMSERFEQIAALSGEETREINAIRELFQHYVETATSLAQAIVRDTISLDEIGTRSEKMTMALSALKNALQAFREKKYEQFTVAIDTANESIQNHFVNSLLMFAASVLIVAVLTTITTAAIVRNTAHVNQSLGELLAGKGDLTRRLHHSSHDELGDVVKKFNAFIAKLQEIIAEIKASIDDVAKSSLKMNHITEACSGNVNTAKTELDQIASAVEQMTQSVDEVARNASLAAENAQLARDAAVQGVAAVEENLNSIDILAGNVIETTGVIKQLEAETENIGQVLDVIRGIAEQTNLLALNAAIEAARAGEQGRGFAVVADEVRSLATKTNLSTQEIQTMIERLQAGAQNAVSVMERGRDQAQASVQQAGEVGQKLSTFTGGVERIADNTALIASAAEELAITTKEISKNINVLADSVTNMSQELDNAVGTSNHLDRIAKSVSEMIRIFKT